ncbi:hypothetical protein [Arthrobacter sp. OY3WO11]|uniref:hypothetical protein n=1 Tax=Arthrobacter sp. OY3WO11 TaxID=1835723 RepID=UPI0007CF620C|nr:hypothetical protein [Arthrobacter sp. OY3WO11]OAE02330.1 hypothetical protein A6A22_13545 [Arthrobacter sp. OY3WO11]
MRAYTFLHPAVDDHSRFVHFEILPDEAKETASAFVGNATAAFTAQGVRIAGADRWRLLLPLRRRCLGRIRDQA